ncbi:MAG: Mfa1 fimbrilin C-terminal domain-containing protein, partial [Muribaculaceae bacterium]|nr:Mfa1 fimbrilin C-terminal domain-containing protein [Muribaculaceae bacterium]
LSDVNNVAGYDNLPDNSISGRGPVKVERSVARLDFRDGSANGDQRYDVLFHYHDGIMQENEPLYGVQLLRIALVNMSNAFYYLPRVSANGLATGAGFTICGAEKPWGANLTGNYVVGPYWRTFGGDAPEDNFSNYFNYPFFEDDGTFANNMANNLVYDTYSIADDLKGTQDNYESTDGAIKKGTYHVWRYITENVIPAGPAKQVNGISTGILFKTKMYGTQRAIDGDFSAHEAAWEKDLINNTAKCLNGQPFEVRRTKHKAVVGNPKDDPLLFYLDGQLYMTWEHIRQAAIQAACTYDATTGQITTINRSNSLYRAVFGDGPIPCYTAEDGTIRRPVYIYGTGIPESHAFTDPQWDSNPNSAAYKAWKASADYAWEMWDEAGRPCAPAGQPVPALLQAMREAVTASDIAIYESAVDPEFGPGYYCYYTYWNRHNDNMQNGVMGPMEFDVVRNNVYKLSVDKINRLGHPRVPDNDPNVPTPDTPDESADIYLDVTLQITPWAVRINSIEF